MKRIKGEGTIYKDKSRDRWIGQYICKDGDVESKRKKVYGKTKEEVSRKLNDIMYKLNNEEYIKKNGATLIQIIDKNIDDKFASNIIQEGQLKRLKMTSNKIRFSDIGNMEIQKITSYDIQQFMNEHIDLCDSYIKKIYELVNSAFKKAEKLKIINMNPMDDVIKPRSRKETKEIRALTIYEQAVLTEYLKSVTAEEENYKNVFLIQMYMGLRVGEVLALTKEDINFIEGYIKVTKTLTMDKDGNVILGTRAKTYASRRKVPIPDAIKYEIKEQLKISEQNEGNFLFTNSNDDLARYKSVNGVLKRIFERNLGLDSIGISTHVLRHTYATRCIEGGMTPVVLQRIMGHTNVSITLNTYTSVFNEYKESELNKVSQYLDKMVLNNKEIKKDMENVEGL